MNENQKPQASVERLFVELLDTVRELRRRCPWDRQQTLESLSRYLIEEAYEAAYAARTGASSELADELGDLLAQILFHAVVAQENSLFTVEEMLAGAREKLVRRHPHVYGNSSAKTADEVVRQWNEIKRNERKNTGVDSALGDGARAMPGAMRAEKLGERARGAGMDWPNVGAVIDKVREELDEAQAALVHGATERAVAEIGDALLALANVPRFLGASVERTLQEACDKFVRRFGLVESIARKRNVSLGQLSEEELEKLWQQAKEADAQPSVEKRVQD